MKSWYQTKVNLGFSLLILLNFGCLYVLAKAILRGDIFCKSLTILDRDGHPRIVAFGDLEGDSYLMLIDKDQKARIVAGTLGKSREIKLLKLKNFENDQKARIEALLSSDGIVFLPTTDWNLSDPGVKISLPLQETVDSVQVPLQK